MSPSPSPRRPRLSAEQRREDVLAAALREFSQKGLHGGSTVAIAADAGLSQPNLFRLFATKKELFPFPLRPPPLAVGGDGPGDHG
ncbi:TetR/AcrR family transcriptional regulator [Streptomyces atratus]